MKALLIADDSHEKIKMIRHFLALMKWNGDVHVAHTTEEAFRFIDSSDDVSYACVDYYIPSQNGPAIIRRLKGKFPAYAIALVSSADNERNAKEAKEAGAEAVICTTHRSDEVERAFKDLVTDWMNREA